MFRPLHGKRDLTRGAGDQCPTSGSACLRIEQIQANRNNATANPIGLREG